MKVSDRIATMVHAFDDAERRDEVRRLAGKVAMMEMALRDLTRNFYLEDHDHDDDPPCEWCRAKAALE